MLSFNFYSPEQEIKHQDLEKHDVRLFLKRDDLIHPFISGNKWRKLKYNLIKAKEEQKTQLVTFGGIWSNHLLATACAAATFGFTSTAFVRGEDINTDVLFLCQMFGMKLQFTDRESYRDKVKLFNNYFSDDAKAYFVDEGGAGIEAAKGCAEIIAELNENYNHVFVAVGTGTTAAGIINGLQKYQPAAETHVVPVLKGADFLRDDIRSLLEDNYSFNFHTDYHFGGYAKTQPELLDFIKNFTASTGILIDPVYTGKMLYAVFDLIKGGKIKPGTKVLAIHTGGLFGILGMKEKFRF